jgi:hypothetical protein
MVSFEPEQTLPPGRKTPLHMIRMLVGLRGGLDIVVIKRKSLFSRQ